MIPSQNSGTEVVVGLVPPLYPQLHVQGSSTERPIIPPTLLPMLADPLLGCV